MIILDSCSTKTYHIGSTDLVNKCSKLLSSATILHSFIVSTNKLASGRNKNAAIGNGMVHVFTSMCFWSHVLQLDYIYVCCS